MCEFQFRGPDPVITWWTRSQPIRTVTNGNTEPIKSIERAAEISAHIKIQPVQHPHLYQKLAQKATELHLLGMSYSKIGKILGIDPKTAQNACRHLRGGT